MSLLSIVGPSGEEIAKRRISYEAAKRTGVERVVSPENALEYLELIEFQSERVAQLEDEIKEIRANSEKRLLETLTSLNDTLQLLKQNIK
jgi:hypothetical protein